MPGRPALYLLHAFGGNALQDLPRMAEEMLRNVGSVLVDGKTKYRLTVDEIRGFRLGIGGDFQFRGRGREHLGHPPCAEGVGT